MKSVVVNLEYSSWCFISFKVKGVLRVERGHFKHPLRHVISYIYITCRNVRPFVFPCAWIQFSVELSVCHFHDTKLLKLWYCSLQYLMSFKLLVFRRVSLFMNSNTVVARRRASCQHTVRSGEVVAALTFTYITESFSSSVTSH
jgi:hypothetical protein